MSTQPDGVNDLLSRDLQAAMAVAGRWGEMMARQRAEQVRQRVTEQQHRRREMEERFEAERAVMRTELAPVDQDRFWESAKPADIAGHYGLARQWEHHDEVAKAARGRIEKEVKDRHGLDVEDYLGDHASHQQRTDADPDRQGPPAYRRVLKRRGRSGGPGAASRSPRRSLADGMMDAP